MRLSRRKKSSAVWDRNEELRRRRAAAQPLRVTCPQATLVSVELRFDSSAEPFHAPQTFVLHPPAKAHFVYACPFGDCSGVYDLEAAAASALRREKRRATGTLTCTGHRTRDGASGQLCELRVSYSIVAYHDGAQASG